MRYIDKSIKARLPWQSIEAMVLKEDLYDTDTEEERERCFNCPYEECINCHCKDKTTQLIDKCEELIAQHQTQKQICEQLKISRRTFYNYKHSCACAM